MRLRMEHFYAGTLAVTIKYSLSRDQAAQFERDAEGRSESGRGKPRVKKHSSGITQTGWGMEARFRPCQDTLSLLEALQGCWRQAPSDREHQRPFFVGVTLRNLIPEDEHQAMLFEEPGNRNQLSATMDKLNLKYGHTTLHFAGMLAARDSAPTRIAFTQIPVQYGQDWM
jgi:DNA polymerase-4